jgi:hypothetical protein
MVLGHFPNPFNDCFDAYFRLLLGFKGSKKVVEFRLLELAQGVGFDLTGCDQMIKLIFRRFQVSCCLLLRERVHYCEFSFLRIVGTTMHQISSPLLAKKEGAPRGWSGKHMFYFVSSFSLLWIQTLVRISRMWLLPASVTAISFGMSTGLPDSISRLSIP